jgi:hypothetical protein
MTLRHVSLTTRHRRLTKKSSALPAVLEQVAGCLRTNIAHCKSLNK